MTEQAIDGRQVARTALRIVGAYAAIASLWVLFSEPALESMFSQPTETVVAGVFEGWLFVAVTSLLLSAPAGGMPRPSPSAGAPA